VIDNLKNLSQALSALSTAIGVRSNNLANASSEKFIASNPVLTQDSRGGVVVNVTPNTSAGVDIISESIQISQFANAYRAVASTILSIKKVEKDVRVESLNSGTDNSFL
jgi:hypothetical protein